MKDIIPSLTRRAGLLAAGAALLTCVGGAQAQTGTVKLIVGYAAGGG